MNFIVEDYKKLTERYRESCQRENEYGWRLANLIVVISLGIFAYTSKDCRNTLLYANWFSLLITFISGCCYIYYIRKLLAKENKELAYKINKEEVKRGISFINYIFTKERVGKWSYGIMLLFFLISIFLFIILLI